MKRYGSIFNLPLCRSIQSVQSHLKQKANDYGAAANEHFPAAFIRRIRYNLINLSIIQQKPYTKLIAFVANDNVLISLSHKNCDAKNLAVKRREMRMQ